MAERFKVTKSGDGGKVRTYAPAKSVESEQEQAAGSDDSDAESGLLHPLQRVASQDGNLGEYTLHHLVAVLSPAGFGVRGLPSRDMSRRL